MKNKLSLLLFSALLFILSCGKDKPSPFEPEYCPPIILLNKVSGTTNLDLTYNDSKYLTKIKDGEKSIEVSYVSDNYVFKLQYLDNTTSTPKRKVVEAQSIIMDGFKPGEELESHYEGNQLLYQSRNNYTYTDELVIKTQTRLDNNSIITQKYTLKNGNIATFDNGNGTIYTYKYDDKRNPFANRILKYRMGSVDFFSANSVVEVEENQNGIRKITKNVYTYNQDGYPLTVKSMNNEGAVVADYKFEYSTISGGCY